MHLLPEPPQGQGGSAVPDAWDHKGRPALPATTGGWISAAMILGVEACERLTTLGIAVNLVTYLTGTMHLPAAAAANTVTNFLGTAFLLCLFGGFVADSFLGRYFTVAIGATIEAMGVTILTFSTIIPRLRPPKCAAGSASCVPASGIQLVVLYVALYLTALGTGGVKSSVSGLGSDQFDDANAEERSQMIKFFHWFFFFINVGSLLAVTVLVYVQENLGRQWGYGIAACGIACGLSVFLSGTRKYRFKKLAGSPLTQIAVVFVAAWRKRRSELPSDPAELLDVEDVDQGKKKQRLPHSDQFRFLDRAAVKESKTEHPKTNKWRLSTQTDVEEVKQVIRMLPIWATTIMFWTVYAQMTTFSVSQATTMDRHITSSFQIPAASLTVFFVGSILLTVPIYDRLIVPVAARIRHSPHGLTQLQRISVGLVLSVFAMAAAALVELKRLRSATGSEPTAISVFWLVPQFFLVGSGEAFTYIGQLDFFLRECPKGMKTMSTGLFLTTLSLGFFLSSMLVAVVDRVTGSARPWLANHLDKGRLYNFYWLLAGLSVANLGMYLVCAKWYVYKDTRLAEVEGLELDEGDLVCHA